MRLEPEALQQALRDADVLFERFSHFSTPQTGASVDPSIPSAVLRFLKTRPVPEDLDLFLQCMPTSSLATRSRSAQPQAREVAARIGALLKEARSRFPDPDQLHLYLTVVLGWTHKRLAEHDKQNQGQARRVGAARRG